MGFCRLKRLDCFESSGYQLGHKAFYVLKDSDVIVSLKTVDEHKHLKPAALHSMLHCRGLLPSSLVTDLNVIKCGVLSSICCNGTDTKMETLERATNSHEEMDNEIGNHNVSV